jgi:predicted RNA-binding Zn-ribbon protein involved in translation (DUF1610 family)
MAMEFPTSSRGDGPPEVIVCVDCGGNAHLLTRFPIDEPPVAGDRLVYRCEDCNDRWDLIVDEEDFR